MTAALTPKPTPPRRRWAGAAAVAATVAALLLLNAAFSLRNWWPTPFVLPNTRLAPEFVALWLLVLGWVAWRGRASARVITLLTLACAALLLGRYANVTVPTLFGRPVNLYWDGQQIPRFLWVSARDYPGWAVALAVLGVLLATWALWKLLHWATSRLARDAAPYALRQRWTWLPTAAAAATVVVHMGGWASSVTWHLVADPITPTYARQAVLLGTALIPGRAEAALPVAQPLEAALQAPPAQALGTLAGRDFTLIFLESYGAMAFEHPRAGPQLAPARAQLVRDIAGSGYLVASAYVRAATFAGASELSHLSLLSGIDLSDPLRHDVLLTTNRPTLARLFAQAGYETVALYPALSWDWPEGRFYGFERLLDARDLHYEGPPLGYWKVPDQFSIASFEHRNPLTADARPRFLFFPTITSHLPFGPVPPYQPDWQRLLTPDPFGAEATERLRNAYVDWLDMLPNYIGMFDYTYRWLGGYLQQPRPREAVMLWVGDHQPAASVSGAGANWDVPVHIVTRDPALLARFVARGFKPGLEPTRPVLGGLHDLNALLLQALAMPAASSSPARTRVPVHSGYGAISPRM